MSSRDRVKSLIADIEKKHSLYYVSKVLQKTYTQVLRIKMNGRCQPDEYEKLVSILDVPCETSQNVSNQM